MVRVFVNLEGLEQTCVDLHLSDSYGTLRQFASGFTQNQPLFDFVDAGRGKERADHKIKGVPSRCQVLRLELIDLFLIELFSLYVQNTHCKHIVLGCCHDNGYVVTLDPHRLDVVTASRITLLQGPRVGREYLVLPFEMLQLSGLFRQTPLASDTTTSRQARPEGCAFAHLSDLSRGEIYAQARRIRLTRCVTGSACRSFQCFYGHVCPYGADCTKGNKCHFKKVHDKDTTAVAVLIYAPGTNHHAAH